MIMHSIEEVSKQTKISASCIRVWETRYKWPRPSRAANGYRQFSTFDVEQLKLIKHFLDQGASIGTLIVDGMLRLPVEQVFDRKTLTIKSFEDLNYRHEFSSKLIEYLLRKEFGKAVHMIQESVVLLRAHERMPLCIAIVRRAIDEYSKLGVNVSELEQSLQCVAC